MPDESYGPSRRIKQRQDFLRIQQRGRKYRTAHFLLAVFFAKDSDPNDSAVRESRLGVTITRKIDKRAAYRNRLKRRIREQFRRKRHRMRRPADLVVIALSGATELGYEEVGAELEQLMSRAKLIRGVSEHR